MSTKKYTPGLLEIKNKKNTIVKLSSLKGLKTALANYTYIDYEIRNSIYEGKLDSWLRQKQHSDLADKLRIFEEDMSAYIQCAVLWHEKEINQQYKFENLVGYDKVKQRLREEADYCFSNNSTPEGILLYGPPGTGKTQLARALANENNAFIARFDYTKLDFNYLNTFFEVNRKLSPTITLFDELEQLTQSKENSNIISAALMTELDKSFENEKVLFIGTTNYPWDIDQALLRTGRFSKKLFIGPPSKKDRLIFFKNNFLKDGLDLNELVDLTEFHSCADISAICLQGQRQKTRNNVLTQADLQRIVKETPSTIIPWIEKCLELEHPDYAYYFFEEMFDLLSKYKEKKDSSKQRAFCFS